MSCCCCRFCCCLHLAKGLIPTSSLTCNYASLNFDLHFIFFVLFCFSYFFCISTAYKNSLKIFTGIFVHSFICMYAWMYLQYLYDYLSVSLFCFTFSLPPLVCQKCVNLFISKFQFSTLKLCWGIHRFLVQ